jgi:hypothetical protein
MSRQVFKEPDQWILFIAMTIASVNGVMIGQLFILLVGIPFLLLSVLIVSRLTVYLWIAFTTGAVVNVILSSVSGTDYFVTGMYALLIVYGLYELFKSVNLDKPNH